MRLPVRFAFPLKNLLFAGREKTPSFLRIGKIWPVGSHHVNPEKKTIRQFGKHFARVFGNSRPREIVRGDCRVAAIKGSTRPMRSTYSSIRLPNPEFWCSGVVASHKYWRPPFWKVGSGRKSKLFSRCLSEIVGVWVGEERAGGIAAGPHRLRQAAYQNSLPRK